MEKYQKLLSICIPTYNRYEKLKQQVEFLLNDSAGFQGEIEVIIGDNASQDNTADIQACLNGAKNFSYIRHDQNYGFSGNFARILDAVSGKYCWIVSDDDPLISGIISRVIRLLKQHGDLGLLLINASVSKQGTIIKEKEFGELDGLYEREWEELLAENFGWLWNNLMFITSNIFLTDVARDAIEKFGSTDAYLACEPLIFNISSSYKRKVYALSKPYITHVYGEDSWNNTRYKVVVRYRAECILKLMDMGVEKRYIKRLLRQLYAKGMNEIFNYYILNLKHPGAVIQDYCWILTKIPGTVLRLSLYYPIYAIYRRIYKILAAFTSRNRKQ